MLLVLVCGTLLLVPRVAEACNLLRKKQKLEQLQQRADAADSAGDAQKAGQFRMRAARALLDMCNKFGPERVKAAFGGTLPFSKDEAKMMITGGGGGSAGVPGLGGARITTSGGSGEVGQTKTVRICLISVDTTNTTWMVTITPDASNPAGFTLSTTSFNLGPIAPGGFGCQDVDVFIGNTVAPGTVARFRATAVNPQTMEQVDDVFADFEVTAVAAGGADVKGLVLCPQTPAVAATPGAPASLVWTVQNLGSSPATVHVTVFNPTDPRSDDTYLNGEKYNVKDFIPIEILQLNLVSTNPITTITDGIPGGGGLGGQMTIPAGETQQVMVDFEANMFCEHAMTGCCRLRLRKVPVNFFDPLAPGESIESKQYLVNDSDASADPIVECPAFASGEAMADGEIQVFIDPPGSPAQTIQVPVFTGGSSAIQIMNVLSMRINEHQLEAISTSGDAPLRDGAPPNAIYDFNRVDITGVPADRVEIQTFVMDQGGQLVPGDIPGLFVGKPDTFENLQLLMVEFNFKPDRLTDAIISVGIDPGPTPPQQVIPVRLFRNGVPIQEMVFDPRSLPANTPTGATGGGTGTTPTGGGSGSTLKQFACPSVAGFTVIEVNGRCLYRKTLIFSDVATNPGDVITAVLDPDQIHNETGLAGRADNTAQSTVQAQVGGGGGSKSGGGGCGAGSPLALAFIWFFRGLILRRRKD